MGTVRALTHHFAASGADAVAAIRQAYATVGGMMVRQSILLAYLDNFWLLGISALVLVPFVFIMKKAKPGGAVAVH
jgi:DHA2 family multidrug resistance protein